MPLESEFIRISTEKLDKLCGRIETCVSKLTPEQVWTRHSENENAIGNLILHLTGNVRQWILSGVGGIPDTRVRDLEFSNREAISPAGLVTGLRAAVREAIDIIQGLDSEGLIEAIRIQNFDVTKMEAVYHVVEHFSGHTFQIIFATKLLTGQDLELTRLPAETSAGVKTP